MFCSSEQQQGRVEIGEYGNYGDISRKRYINIKRLIWIGQKNGWWVLKKDSKHNPSFFDVHARQSVTWLTAFKNVNCLFVQVAPFQFVQFVILYTNEEFYSTIVRQDIWLQSVNVEIIQ